MSGFGVNEKEQVYQHFEGRGRAKVGEEVFSLEPGTSFIAPAGMEHYICRDADCPYIKLFFFHAFSD